MTKFQKYVYSGPLSSASIRVDGRDIDVLLNPKIPVQLPAEHEYTRMLIALRRLTPVIEAGAPAEQVTGQAARKSATTNVTKESNDGR